MKESRPNPKENLPLELQEISARQAAIRQMLETRTEYLEKLRAKLVEYDKILDDLKSERKKFSIIAAIPEKQEEAVAQLEKIAEYVDNTSQVLQETVQEIKEQLHALEFLNGKFQELSALYTVLQRGYENYKNLPKA